MADYSTQNYIRLITMSPLSDMGVIENVMITLTILRNDRALFFCLARKQVLPRLKKILLLHTCGEVPPSPFASPSGPMGASIEYLARANNVLNNHYLSL